MTVDSDQRRLLGSVSGTIAARFGVVIFGISTSILSARILGPAGRGQYFAVTTIANLLAQGLNFGLTSSNVILAAKDRTRIRPLLVNSVYVAVMFGTLGVFVAMLAGGAISSYIHLPRGFLFAICVVGASALLWHLGSSLLIAEERFKALNLCQLGSAFANVIGFVICSIKHAGVVGFVITTTLVSFLAALGLLGLLLKGRAGGSNAFSWTLARQGFRFSSRAYMALFFGYFLQRSGAMAMTIRGHARSLGQYSIASQGFDVLLIIPASVGTVLFPYLVRAREDTWRHVKRAALHTTLLMGLVSAASAISGRWLIPVLFGEHYSAAVPVLWTLLPGVIFYSAISVLSQYLVRRDFPWKLVGLWALGLLVAFNSAELLIRKYGAIGAALGQSLGALVVCAGVLMLINFENSRHSKQAVA